MTALHAHILYDALASDTRSGYGLLTSSLLSTTQSTYFLLTTQSIYSLLTTEVHLAIGINWRSPVVPANSHDPLLLASPRIETAYDTSF